jgi:hypothetical protein
MKIRRLIVLILLARLLVMAEAHWVSDKDKPKTAEGLIIAASSSAAAKLGEIAAPVVDASKKRFFTSYSAAMSTEVPDDPLND